MHVTTVKMNVFKSLQVLTQTASILGFKSCHTPSCDREHVHLTHLQIFYYRCIWYLRQSFGPTYDKILIGGKFLASLALLKVDKVSESISVMYSVCNVELNMS